ncbi:hypothetical protein [Kitasatospora cathayae]|uniref:Uncharacterized protein n=1 Tax=Kitasatospora cathayae TaxID=3004092 RepID=A0ABY7Q4I4_9ACTN|nr:hypothetical protein [Kitasatospora sp. HUAS 3-15]WBP87575.1 hypothetical protein O1G21_18170 [Kitasatospora sp. HUAS 3-15]
MITAPAPDRAQDAAPDRAADPAPEPDVLVTSRPLDEYCALFGLTRARLAALPGPLLDCPGGAAGLAAEARELGCRVIAADPAYALPPPAPSCTRRRVRAARTVRSATCAAGTAPAGCSPRTRSPTRSATWPPRCPGSRSRTAPSPSP